MKTPVTILEEVMAVLNMAPEYEFMGEIATLRGMQFQYKCQACGEQVTSVGKTKIEAMQEASRLVLYRLAVKGHEVPAPYGLGSQPLGEVLIGAEGTNHMTLLRDLCQEYQFQPVEYDIIGAFGPPHQQVFTVKARVGHHERMASASTKKGAHQMAAEKLYTFLRNAFRVETIRTGSDLFLRRRNLGIRMVDYHLALAARLSPHGHARVTLLLESEGERRVYSPVNVLDNVAQAMRLRARYSKLHPDSDAPGYLLELWGCTPEMSFAGNTPADAANAALDYIRNALYEVPHVGRAAAQAHAPGA